MALGLALGLLMYTRHVKQQQAARAAAEAAAAAAAAPPPAIVLPPAPILNPDELRRVVGATKDPDQNVRWEAAKFLVKLNHPDADDVLFSMLSRDSAVEIRVRVAELLSVRTGPKISQSLVGALKDTEPPVRIAALRALANVGDFQTAPAISDVLKDSDESVRVEAVKTLNVLQDKRNEWLEQERRRLEEERRKAEEERKRRAEEMKK